jgi:DNA-directed RNA polymerase subunit omega
MNAELVKKALEKVVNANVLVNLISRRVRQLNAGGGGLNRPLIANTENLGAADVALGEIAEEKMGFEMPDIEVLIRPNPKSRKKPQHSVRHKTNEENGGTGFPAIQRTETTS